MSELLRTRYLGDKETEFLAKSHPEIMDRDFCPTCGGDGFFMYKRKRRLDCDCEMQRQLYRHYLSAGIPLHYMRLDWPDFKGSKSIRTAAAEYVSKADKYIAASIGLMLTGANGIGKTMVLVLTLKDMIRKGYKCFFTTADDLFAMKTDGWTDAIEKERFNEKVKNSKILVVDDAGKEFSNRVTKQTFDSLIRYRSQNALTTLVSSNQSLRQLGAEYGESFASLISGNYIVKPVEGEDYRSKALDIRLDEIENEWVRPIT